MRTTNEWYGADTMGTDANYIIPSPDEKRFNHLMYTAGASTTVVGLRGGNGGDGLVIITVII